MPIGFVSYINNRKKYGYIDSPGSANHDIYLNLKRCNKSYEKILPGDKIFFEFYSKSSLTPTAISLLERCDDSLLKKNIENGHFLKGVLQKFDDRYFVKNEDTYMFIPLLRSIYETEINKVYEQCIGNIIDYRITSTSSGKFRAINVNRRFVPFDTSLEVGQELEARVVTRLKGGYQIQVLGSILGFLPQSLVHNVKSTLIVDEIISVTCIRTADYLNCTVFGLTESLENTRNQKDLLDQKSNFLSSLKKGDRIIGVVKDVRYYGVFFTFGLAEGFLPIKDFLGVSMSLPKSLRYFFLEVLTQGFTSGREVNLIFDSHTESRISVVLDKSVPQNISLYNEIYDKLKQLDIIDFGQSD
ncbi:MAG: hypothetical protein ACK5C0_15495 [Candidatus Kapaibacterium sp.]|jgi:hypothetical protein